jgi:hypothetical protein
MPPSVNTAIHALYDLGLYFIHKLQTSNTVGF